MRTLFVLTKKTVNDMAKEQVVNIYSFDLSIGGKQVDHLLSENTIVEIDFDPSCSHQSAVGKNRLEKSLAASGRYTVGGGITVDIPKKIEGKENHTSKIALEAFEKVVGKEKEEKHAESVVAVFKGPDDKTVFELKFQGYVDAFGHNESPTAHVGDLARIVPAFPESVTLS